MKESFHGNKNFIEKPRLLRDRMKAGALRRKQKHPADPKVI